LIDAGHGRVGSCATWQEIIQSKQVQQLSARRIHQNLVSEHGASVSYDSVRRFLCKLGRAKPLPFRRVESMPGAKAQVDFGTGAPIIGADGRKLRTHVFRTRARPIAKSLSANLPAENHHYFSASLIGLRIGAELAGAYA